jgi:uncharacterized protein
MKTPSIITVSSPAHCNRDSLRVHKRDIIFIHPCTRTWTGDDYEVTFVCQLYGECCSIMGETISIREEIGTFQYQIWYTTTGKELVVTLDPDKRDLFHSVTPANRSSLACPFLRKRQDHKVICTVHLSRPDLCRNYSCFWILILNSDGKKAGRVMGNTRYFTTIDSHLHEPWLRECTVLDIADEN